MSAAMSDHEKASEPTSKKPAATLSEDEVKDARSGPSGKASDREARLGARLRDNLRRRKGAIAHSTEPGAE